MALVATRRALLHGHALRTGAAGPAYGAGADLGGGPWVWSTLSALATADDNGATVGPADPASSTILRMSTYGFAVPPSATITGVVVETRSSRTSADVTYNLIQLVSAGVNVGSNKSAGTENHPVSGTWYDFPWGGAADLWGATLTPAIVNAAGFGVDVRGGSVGANWNWAVDYARMTIYYTA